MQVFFFRFTVPRDYVLQADLVPSLTYFIGVAAFKLCC